MKYEDYQDIKKRERRVDKVIGFGITVWVLAALIGLTLALCSCSSTSMTPFQQHSKRITQCQHGHTEMLYAMPKHQK